MKSPVKIAILTPLALMGLLLAALAVIRFCRGEVGQTLRNFSHEAEIRNDNQRRKVAVESLAHIPKFGARVRYFGYPQRGIPGLYIDLSQWTGTSSDFRYLAALEAESRPDFFLSLQGTSMDDRHIDYLCGLTNLNYVDLTGTQVTDKGIAKLQNALPKLTIIRSAQGRNDLGRSTNTRWIQHLPGYLQAPVAAGTRPPAFASHHHSAPAESVTVLSGTTFLLSQKKCRLLGVAEPDDAASKAKAHDFAELWFRFFGKDIAMVNETNPRRSADGTHWVWVGGHDGSSLNAELIRASNAKVDYSQHNMYEFMHGQDYFVAWREILDEAIQDSAKGGAPRVTFPWPPQPRNLNMDEYLRHSFPKIIWIRPPEWLNDRLVRYAYPNHSFFRYTFFQQNATGGVEERLMLFQIDRHERDEFRRVEKPDDYSNGLRAIKDGEVAANVAAAIMTLLLQSAGTTEIATKEVELKSTDAGWTATAVRPQGRWNVAFNQEGKCIAASFTPTSTDGASRP